MRGVDQARRDRLRRAVAEELGTAVLLVTDLCDVRYLTGFSGSNGVLALGASPEDDIFATDGRYVDQAAEQVPDLPCVVDRDTLATLAATLQGREPGVRLLAQESMPVGEFEVLRAAGAVVHPAPALAASLRERKDADELARLSKAGEITVASYASLLTEIGPGWTELAVARRLEQLFGEHGAEDRAFATIVASGPHSAIPHHEPGGRSLALGDLVVVDAGARVEGYHADMTRTFVVGDPQPWQVDLHAAVLAAQAAGREACHAGTALRDIDAAAREPLRAAGLEDRFTHGLGHGVGLAIHEAPMIGPRATGTLAADMVITVEPGVYLPGRGGVRIEDTLVVTDAGPRVLTETPRELCVVD